MAVRDQPLKRQAAGFDELPDLLQVRLPPLRRDPEAGLAHESGREGETEGLVVEAGQHDLPAGREALDERVEQRRVAADVDRLCGSARCVSSSGDVTT